MILRCFNEKGIDEFRMQMNEIKIGVRKEFDRNILINDDLTSPYKESIEIELNEGWYREKRIRIINPHRSFGKLRMTKRGGWTQDDRGVAGPRAGGSLSPTPPSHWSQ